MYFFLSPRDDIQPSVHFAVLYVQDTLRFICVSHLALYTIYLLWSHRNNRSALYTAGFCAGLIGFVLTGYSVRSSWPLPLLLLTISASAGLSFFFWLMTLSLFRESFRARGQHWLILGGKIAVHITTYYLLKDPERLTETERFVYVLPAILFSALLAALAMRETLREYDSDLIETRRRLRFVYLVAGGGAILFVVVFRLGANSPDMLQVFDLGSLLLTLALIYAFFLSAFSLRYDLLDEDRRADPEIAALDQELHSRLVQTFENERFYREEGLTIRRLAVHLGTQEHKLRNLINRGLGYKNFNEFLNKYRIQEACEILLDPEKLDRTIVRIATDLGYRSPGSFNKAFRDITGRTPSDYRRRPS